MTQFQTCNSQKTYEVSWTEEHKTTVTANNEEEADDLAKEQHPDTTCQHCHGTEVNEVQK